MIHVKAKDDASRTMAATRGEASKLGVAAGKMGAMVGVAAAAIGVKLVQALGDSIAEAREAQKVHNQTVAVLKSTGHAAGLTGKQIEMMAGRISNLTGIDDELIQSGENILLTFTNIRNDMKHGNMIFDEATMAITDLSVALGQDMKTSAIQVGKALNDPVKGMSALRRVGVSFNKEQEKTIKHLVKTGKTAEAQKVILHELEKEFGGSAEAAATWGDKAKVAADNMKEAFGKKLLKPLDRVSKWFVKDGAKAIQDFMDGIDTSTLNDAADSIISLGKGLQKFTKLSARFGNAMDEQKAMVLGWRISMLKAALAVADAWGHFSVEGRKAAKHLRQSLSEAQDEAAKTANKINKQKIVAKIKADKKDLEAKVKDAQARLRATHNQKTQSKIRGEISDLRAKIASARAMLNALNGKTAVTHIIARYSKSGGKGTTTRKTATGGNIGASWGGQHAAEGGSHGGRTLVGEEGPELVDLPFGSHVNSNADSRRIGMGDGGSGGGVHFHFHGPVYGDHNALKRALVNMKRSGDLDLVLR